MSYKPRSGAFRKVKYPIKILKDDEISAEDLAEVLEMTRKIKAEEASESGDQLPDHENIVKEKCNNPEVSPQKELAIAESGPRVKMMYGELSQPEFSLAPVNYYDKCYADDDSMPPFPVVSCPEPDCDSDLDTAECESDYDMDSEDEEWLDANPSLYITPNRLEYIFSQLNKRNTHVPEKAIGALPAAVHSDFFHVFPYWKQKRLQNKNVSSFRSSLMQMQTDLMRRDAKLASGYLPTDPTLAFVCKVRKSHPPQPQPPVKKQPLLVERHKAQLAHVVAAQGQLINLRSILLSEIRDGLSKRDMIKNKIVDLSVKYQNYDSLSVEVADPEKAQKDKTARGTLKRAPKASRIPASVIGTRVTRQSSCTKRGVLTKLSVNASNAEQQLRTLLSSKAAVPAISNVQDESRFPKRTRAIKKSMCERVVCENKRTVVKWSKRNAKTKKARNVPVTRQQLRQMQWEP